MMIELPGLRGSQASSASRMTMTGTYASSLSDQRTRRPHHLPSTSMILVLCFRCTPSLGSIAAIAGPVRTRFSYDPSSPVGD